MRSVFVAFAFIIFGLSAAAQTVDLTLNEARNVATNALLGGEPALAEQIAEAILEQLPDDRAALVIIAAAAPGLGDPAKGRRAGARAWAVSRGDAQKYEAARLTALAAANEERFTLSTFWLRRALTVAPNDDARAQTLSDARVVRQRNPWSTQLSFSLAPSSNLNGGAEDEISTAPGNPTGTFSEDALALSGWRASLAFGTQYRFQQNARSRSTVGLQYQISRSKVTDDTSVPDESFDTSVAELSLRHDRALEAGTITARLSHSKIDYRDLNRADGTTVGEYYEISRAGLSRRIPVDDRTFMSFSFDREIVSYSIADIGDVTRNVIGTGIGHRLESGDLLRGTFTLTDSEGDNVNYTSQDKTLGTTYSWAEPIGPITLSLGGGLKWTDYPSYRIVFPVPGGRKDKIIFANADIGFPEISYAGFTPGLRIDAIKTDSNVSRFDRTTLSVGLTISSQF